MPTPTPKQKLEQVEMFGGDYVTVKLVGDTFDDAQKEAAYECEVQGKAFVHPFNDPKIIEGQATVGLEILEQFSEPIRLRFCSRWWWWIGIGIVNRF